MTKARHRKSRWQDPLLVAGPEQQIQHKFLPLYALGFDGFRDRMGQVACVEPHVIVYGVGGNVVFHSISNDKQMRFFSSSVTVELSVPLFPAAFSVDESLREVLTEVATLTTESKAILWVEASPGGSLVVACEKLNTGQCQVSIIDVKKLEAVNTFPAHGHGVFGASAFSDDERKFMAACNFEHSSQLDFWDVRDGRVLLSTTVPYEITKITFNPLNSDEFAVSGPSHFRFWNIKAGKKETTVQGLHDDKDLTEEQIEEYTDHAWLVETSVALSTANRRIYIVRNYIVQQILINTGRTLCILRTHRGFLAGKYDGSLVEYIGFDLYKVKIAEKDQKNPYAEVRPITILSGLSPISSMVMPPNGEQIIYMVAGDKVLKIHLGIGDDEDALLGTDTNARILSLSVFRMGYISGIDVCPQRMLLVTCGSDCFLRVWSYQRMICEISHVCDEEPSLVTISPWGHYVFVAMARRVQIFRIVGYKLQHCKDIGGVKNIKQLKFSPSGHMVAAANSREILLICAFTWKIKATLKGHTGSVTTLAWSPDSVYLMSAGLDGAIYGWFLDGYHRYLEYVIKGSIYSCLLVDPQRTFILACGPNLSLRVIDTDKKLGISHGKEFAVVGEELVSPTKDSNESVEEVTSSNPPTPENETPPSSVSPTSEDRVSHTPTTGHGSTQGKSESPGPATDTVVRKRDSTVGTEEHPEGSWVQHKYRSNCMFELTHEKPATLMAGFFKAGLLITTEAGGEIRMYTYPFARDAPNLLKEVVLLPTGEITGLCLDEDKKLIFACTSQGSIFVSTVEVEILGPKVEDPYEEDMMGTMKVIPATPGILQYLQDTGTDATNMLLERDEVEEMKRDLQELKLTMAREVKDASFRAQRAALEWSADMKEREAGYLERAKEYEVQVKLLSHNLHVATSEKETAIQELLETQRSTMAQLEDFYRNKLAQELERSHISRTQFQKDLAAIEMEMRDKEQIYLEKVVRLERELDDADARAQDAIKKVRDECDQINKNYKMEMEEDLLISDEEITQTLERLNTEVTAEKDRADDNYEQLLLQKRQVMQLEKKMKDMLAEHNEHIDLIEKMTTENEDLKKTIMELDYERKILKKAVLITDEKTQNLVTERKDQETKTIVRDFKIQQLRKREQPLEKEVSSLRLSLKEMERHQLSHVMEMKHQTLIVDSMKAKVAVLEEDIQKLSDQLRERDHFLDMFSRALCQLVQEHDVSEWPQLIRQLYVTFVKDVHRTDTLDHLDALAQVMHQRENLEKFVAILQREIGRSELRNWRETQKYMHQNLDMLHEYNDAQRNVKRLAFMTQKLQGDVIYWRATAATKQDRTLRTTFEMSPSKASPQLDNQPRSFSRCSKSTRKSTPSMKMRASMISSAELSRASSPLVHEPPMSQEFDKAKEMLRSSTPVTSILKPYQHRGTIASAASLRHSFIQNRPWSPEFQSDKDKAMILDLTVQVNEMAKELRNKNEIIRQMQKASRLSGSFSYLPQARSQSLLERSASEEGLPISALQFAPLNDQTGTIQEGPRRPQTVPTLPGKEYWTTGQNLTTSSRPPPDFRSAMKSGDPLSSGLKPGGPWVPESAESLDFKFSSGHANAGLDKTLPSSGTAPSTSSLPVKSASGPIHSRRASSPPGVMSVLIDGSSVERGGTTGVLLDPETAIHRTSPPSAREGPQTAVQRSVSPSNPVHLHPMRRFSESPARSGTFNPRITSLQSEDASLAAEKFTGIEPLPPVHSPDRRSSLSPPPADPPGRSSSPFPILPASPPNPTPHSVQLEVASHVQGMGDGIAPVPSSSLPNRGAESLTNPEAPAPFVRKKSSLMKGEVARSGPAAPRSLGAAHEPRRKSKLQKSEGAAASRLESRSSITVSPAGIPGQLHKNIPKEPRSLSRTDASTHSRKVPTGKTPGPSRPLTATGQPISKSTEQPQPNDTALPHPAALGDRPPER